MRAIAPKIDDMVKYDCAAALAWMGEERLMVKRGALELGESVDSVDRRGLPRRAELVHE